MKEFFKKNKYETLILGLISLVLIHSLFGLFFGSLQLTLIFKAKKDSIATYGDLTDSKNTISVSYDGTIKYTVNEQELNFDQLKAEAWKQGITSLTTEVTLDTSDLKGLDIDQLATATATAKENSIARYGDLMDLTVGTLGVSYNGTNFVFQIDTKNPITGIDTFKTQYDLQSGRENKLTTINQIEIIIGATKFKNGELVTAKNTKLQSSVISHNNQKTQENNLFNTITLNYLEAIFLTVFSSILIISSILTLTKLIIWIKWKNKEEKKCQK